MESHITGEFTRIMSIGNKFKVALMHAFSETVEGPNPLGAPGFQPIELKMHPWKVHMSYSFGF